MTTSLISTRGHDLAASLEPARKDLAIMLPPHMNFDRFVRTIVMSHEAVPKLYECTAGSRIKAAMTAAVLGLEVDGATGQAYLLPFNNRRQGTMLCQFLAGYKGYNTLADRAGYTITADVVREGEKFDFQLGTDAYVHHSPGLHRNPTARIEGAWAIASRPNRTPIVEVMSLAEIMQIRDKAPGARRKDSPWNDPGVGFPAMAAKTVRRRLARSMPLSTFQVAAAVEQQHELLATAVGAEKDELGNVVVTTEADVDQDLLEGPKDIETYWIDVPGKPMRHYPTTGQWMKAMLALIQKNKASQENIRRLAELNTRSMAFVGAVDAEARDRVEEAFSEGWVRNDGLR